MKRHPYPSYRFLFCNSSTAAVYAIRRRKTGVMEKRSLTEVHMEGAERKAMKRPNDNRPVRGRYK